MVLKFFFSLSQNHKLTFWKYTCWLPKKRREKKACGLFEMTAGKCVLDQDEEGNAWGLINLRTGYREGHKGCQQLEPKSRAAERENKATLPTSSIQTFYTKKIMHFLLWTVACFCYWNACKPLKKQRGKHSPTLAFQIRGIGTFSPIRILLNSTPLCLGTSSFMQAFWRPLGLL